MIISIRIGHTSEVYIWLSNKLLCKIYIRDTLNYLNSRCNTAKLLWVVIYVVCYGWFSPDLVVINICRQRLIKVDRPLWQRSLANENAVVCRQGAMRWRLGLCTLPDRGALALYEGVSRTPNAFGPFLANWRANILFFFLGLSLCSSGSWSAKTTC